MLFSKNGAAILVLLLSFIGVQVDTDGAYKVLEATMTVVSFITLIYHQVIERPDVHNFFFKK
jgi:uncharacterized membrane protein YbjE (DUF340 family)